MIDYTFSRRPERGIYNPSFRPRKSSFENVRPAIKPEPDSVDLKVAAIEFERFLSSWMQQTELPGVAGGSAQKYAQLASIEVKPNMNGIDVAVSPRNESNSNSLYVVSQIMRYVKDTSTFKGVSLTAKHKGNSHVNHNSAGPHICGLSRYG